jgi:hypothetical protein
MTSLCLAGAGKAKNSSSPSSADGDCLNGAISQPIDNHHKLISTPTYKYPTSYIVIDKIDQGFKEVIDLILRESQIGFGVCGQNLNRRGQLCWIQVATSSSVFLFDIKTLGKEGFRAG